MVPEIPSTTDKNFFVIMDHFLPFYPPSNLKNQNFEKMKKIPRDIIILHMCTINDSHMMYGSWDMECNRQNFFVILDHFLHFYPPTIQKFKILKKWKKPPGDIITLNMCTINDNHMMYSSWDMSMTDTIFCHFWPFFALLLP